MGASGWNYFASYKPDIEQVLQELRETVFQEKRYGDPAMESTTLPAGTFDHLPPEQAALVRELMRRREDALAELHEAQEGEPEPVTIEDLLERCGESGTHSIIDIVGVSDTPDFGTAFPMPDDVKLDLYGTTTPTRVQVEAKIQTRADELDRWQCWYVVVYDEAGRASEIYFEGCSGD
jgi:hypothetical protein